MLLEDMTKCCKYKILVQLLIVLILVLLYLKLDSLQSTDQADPDENQADENQADENQVDQDDGLGNVGTSLDGSVVDPWESQPIQLSDSTRFLFPDPTGFMAVTSDGSSTLVFANPVTNFKDFDLVELRTGGTMSAYHEVMREELADDKVLGHVGSAYERLVAGFSGVLIYSDIDQCVVSGVGNFAYIPILIPPVQQFVKSELQIRNTSSVNLRLIFRTSDTVILDMSYVELDPGHHIVNNKRDDAWNL